MAPDHGFPGHMTYRGRFAPSPTGPLHAGSLVAAVASYLDARAHGGRWLVRMEDLDPLRESPQAADQILASLEAHGLEWDESVRFQSQRSAAYEELLTQWRHAGVIYPCACSRKQLNANQGRHPGQCRDFPDWHSSEPVALRFAVPDRTDHWNDQLLGPQHYQLQAEIDDFIVRRKEGFYAYHLAVVCDDIDQGITDIVRGQDLLELTPLHLLLYETMKEPAPRYSHIPLVCNNQGQKLSKQNRAPALDDSRASDNLVHALSMLGQKPPAELYRSLPDAILQWGVDNWDRSPLVGHSNAVTENAGRNGHVHL